jgi:acetyl-CoA carboxylase carboxyltransferase component
MAIKKHIQELEKRREEVRMGGGEKAIEKQEAMGKMTARNRIQALLDPNSFQEYDMFVQHEARDFDMAKKNPAWRWCYYWYGNHVGKAGVYFCSGFHCGRRITRADALAEDRQDHGTRT